MWTCQCPKTKRGRNKSTKTMEGDYLTAGDLDGVLSDEDIIKAAYAFWFADKDWVGKWGKIWTYMCSNQAK